MILQQSFMLHNQDLFISQHDSIAIIHATQLIHFHQSTCDSTTGIMLHNQDIFINQPVILQQSVRKTEHETLAQRKRGRERTSGYTA